MTPKQFEKHAKALKELGARRVRVSTPTVSWDVQFVDKQEEKAPAIGFMTPPEPEQE